MAKTPKQELKAFDVADTAANFVTSAGPPTVVSNLNVPINGAELYQRVGRKIYMKSLHLRGTVLNIATAVQDVLRIIVYYDSQPNAAAPTFANLMQDSNAAAGSTVFSEINLVNRQRFKILKDHQMITPSCTNTAGVLTNLAYPQTDNELNFDFFIKLKGLESVFNGTNGGTIADITSGALGFVIISGVTNNSWQLTYSTRLRYYD